MIGQGSPRTSPGQFASVAQAAAWWGRRFALLAPLLFFPCAAPAAEETMRIRIAWGGGSERLWQGTVAVSPGAVCEPLPLGVEADECGCCWLETEGREGANRLVIRQRSPRSYDGVDVLLKAPLDARLVVQLGAADDPGRPARIEVPLATLSNELQNKELDNQGNRLVVRRAPGDVLRVSFQRESLVFVPGEVFKFVLEPHLLPAADGTKLRIKVQLFAARSQRELWSTQQNFQVGQAAPLTFEVPLGLEEGAYDMVIAAAHASGWPQAVRQSLSWNKTVAERSVQLLVLSPDRPTVAGKAEPELSQVVPLDPANPRWWEVLGKLPQLPKIPRLWKAPLGNGNMQIWRHPLGETVRLNPSSQSPDVSWEAYTLPISQPGRPYVLEVDYPSDVPQSLGISILEPNAAGALMPIGLDSGVDLAEEIIGGQAPRWLRHRLIFWPRTTNPVLLMTNRRDHVPAVYGKIRVMGGWERLPRALSLPPRPNQRLLAAYFDRPLFPENFSASEALDAWSGHSLDDWVTFHEGGTRLVEYLQHVGYNALMLSVLADGSTMYPSALVESTPRYDKGLLFASGQDPVRKDVLEMLFRLFDREQLQLIPALDFSTPLPALEAILRRGGPESEATQWIGPEGIALPRVVPPQRGLAPYYNVLSPHVQQALQAVVREVAARYGRHKSFGGLAIQLSARGYAQLPGPEWGLDDATIARFQQDTHLRLPGSGPGRFAQRAEALLGEHRLTWLQWRAEKLSRFYHQLHGEVNTAGREARLYLAGANIFANEELEYQLRPALTRRTTTMAEALLRVGIDPQHYQAPRGPVLLRPERITPAGAPAAWAVNLEISQMPDVDRCFQGLAVPGSLFFHHPQEARIESFDQKSPFKPTYTWLVSQLPPAGRQNRRRFVHSLAALDAQVLVDGGCLLPMGEEESIRDLVAAYRRLPAVHFERVDEKRQTGPAQPVTVRYATHGGRTYLYAVNDAPFRTTAYIRLDAPNGCRLEELTGTRPLAPLKKEADGTYWTVELEPYDLLAVQWSEPGVQPGSLRVATAESVEATLKQRIGQLSDLAAELDKPPPLKVLANPDFERPAAGDERIPGWTATVHPAVTIQPDKAQAHSGSQSARMTSSGPVACLVSQPFAAPVTGRLSISVWLRVADAARQPPLRLALEGKFHGQPYYRYGEVGSAPAAQRIEVDWDHPYVLPFDDLPLEGLSQLRVRFDLMGAGEVWIDDLQLFDLAFNENERRQLAKLITAADIRLQDRQVGDCLRLLEGYWPRFLEGNVPLPQPTSPVAKRPDAAPQPADADAPQQPPPRTGWMDRVKNLLPERLRF
jgi:hypothetical protein